MNETAHIDDNLAQIRQRLKDACQRAGRSVDQIALMGVTKTIDPLYIEASIKAGIADIGENRPQEIKRKYDLVQTPVRWHMIGHLQSNKVKMIIDKVALIHSVDRHNLVDEIEKRAQMADRIIDVLIQVNIGDESQKSGIAEGQAIELVKYAASQPHIRVVGLMCIAPYLTDPEAVRPYFKKMKQLFDNIEQQTIDNATMQILSMGMTHDFEVAIEEGATMIRVGTGIYGARHYERS